MAGIRDYLGFLGRDGRSCLPGRPVGTGLGSLRSLLPSWHIDGRLGSPAVCSRHLSKPLMHSQTLRHGLSSLTKVQRTPDGDSQGNEDQEDDEPE